MYLEARPRIPRFPITSLLTTTFSTLLVAAVVAATGAPRHANAFWPFSANVSAAQIAPLPGASTPALAASTNIDPNPDKGLAASIQTSGGKALLASTGPSGTMTDVASSTLSGRISAYTVRPGDTLSEIAELYGVSVNTILWANNLTGKDDITPGDTLVILPVSGVEYTTIKGDTPRSVAKKYGADAGDVAQYNGLSVDEVIALGSRIIVPGAELGHPMKAPRTLVRRPDAEPYLGGGGARLTDFFTNPLPGGVLTQGIHGWNAVDLGAARGTPVHAAADGKVLVVHDNGGWNGGYGDYIVLTHANGVQTLYAHLSRTTVAAGQSVSADQVIGTVGMTGHTTGPHVHFEVRGAANPFMACALDSVCDPE